MAKWSNKLRRSGFPPTVGYQVIRTALEKWDKMCEEEDAGVRPVHRPREWKEKEAMRLIREDNKIKMEFRLQELREGLKERPREDAQGEAAQGPRCTEVGIDGSGHRGERVRGGGKGWRWTGMSLENVRLAKDFDCRRC